MSLLAEWAESRSARLQRKSDKVCVTLRLSYQAQKYSLHHPHSGTESCHEVMTRSVKVGYLMHIKDSNDVTSADLVLLEESSIESKERNNMSTRPNSLSPKFAFLICLYL